MFMKHTFSSSKTSDGLQIIASRLFKSSAALSAKRAPPPRRPRVIANRTKDLRDNPDYSFLDGRPTPFGVNQAFRVTQTREFVSTIVKYSNELDAVKAEWAAKRQAEQDAIQDRLARKLKPKGERYSQTLPPRSK